MSEKFAELTAFADEVLAPGFGPVTLTAEQRESLMRMIYRDTGALEPGCADCGLSYTDSGWVDCVISRENWAAISPTGDEGGLLCLTCVTRRIVASGLDDVPLLVTSGPYVYGPNTSPQGEKGKEYAMLERQGEERKALLEEFFQNVRAGGPLTRREAIYDELVAADYTPPQGEQ